ncbi:LAMI_0G13498g1_1 [Lachancea mirantina]|uniref:SPS-sensor serine protease component SSY5 n=1 Tax=Lachancea mirantina TaxID=1230905 RepID=A0A1G4KBQ5_9SACH|nr:LAMI_0G13498g1_1 [Lachancea mirantina]
MVRRIFGIGRKSESPEESSKKDTPSSSSPSQGEKISGTFNEAPNLTRDYTDDTISHVSSSLHSSVFSRSRRTYDTGASSTRTGSTKRKEDASGTDHDIGRPLRVLDFEKLSLLSSVAEEEDSARDHSHHYSSIAGETQKNISGKNSLIQGSHGNKKEVDRPAISVDVVTDELRILEDNLAALMDDIHQNVTNISKAVIEAVEYFKRFLPDYNSSKIAFRASALDKNKSLRKITKVVLHFFDNLLHSEVFSNSRAILMKRYIDFLKKLNVSGIEEQSGPRTLPHPRNFCIDHECDLPHKDNIAMIMQQVANAESSIISDQEGAFIAPILRGLTSSSAVLTVMFGLPSLQQEHEEMVKALYSLFPDVHFFCVKDYIKNCADVIPSIKPRPMENKALPKFQPPYRLLTDAMSPPISMSLSSDQSKNISGTLGGYLYPQIDNSKPSLSQFSGSTFAITCAHVVLQESQDYPHVSVPSHVLQNQYKGSLYDESLRYGKDSNERTAFESEIFKIEQNLQWQRENPFGQVVWGERSIVDKRLSDFAIVKVNPAFNCANYLGDDVAAISSPTLRFQNSYVKEKVLKPRAGTEIFKIGATTKYTTGRLNGSKLVYWADGKIQSSEFVISSPSPLFAAGGDSGAWILTRLTERVGLGVLGMLHSYDGELRQFGLYTPIVDILERLNTVTGVLWDIEKPNDA